MLSRILQWIFPVKTGNFHFSEHERKYKIIAGLGNPGSEYAETRHNIGILMLKKYCDGLKIRKNHCFPEMKMILSEKNDFSFWAVFPEVYMNHSGRAVKKVKEILKPESDLLVIYDDLDLELGRIRFRQKGGSAGHNGIKSIFYETGTQDFHRLRIGIKTDQASRTPDFVLGHFSETEQKIINGTADRIFAGISCYLENGIEKAMAEFNRDI